MGKAAISMLESIEEEVLKRCNNYFRDVYFNAPDIAQNSLKQLSHGVVKNINQLDIDISCQRWLQRRLLVSPQGELNIPMFGRWIREFSEAY